MRGQGQRLVSMEQEDLTDGTIIVAISPHWVELIE